MLKTSIHLHLCSTSANKYDSLWLCVSVGPACSSLKHKTSSGKLGHGSSASLIKCSSFLSMTVTSICYNLMLKSSAQVRLQMRSNACSTIPTLFCHIKHIREREERVQAGDSHHHGSCGVLGVLQCPGFFAVVVESHVVHSESLLYHPSSAWEAWVGWVFGSSLAWDVRVGVVFQILISMRQSENGFWSLISMRGEWAWPHHCTWSGLIVVVTKGLLWVVQGTHPPKPSVLFETPLLGFCSYTFVL